VTDLAKEAAENPDAVLFTEKGEAELLERVTWHTVPLYMYAKGLDLETADDDTEFVLGSGLLFTIDGTFFMLTAGHVLEDLAKMDCAVGVKNGAHRFSPMLVRHRFELDGDRDFGYVEIPAADRSRFETGNRVFAGPNRFEVSTAAELAAADDWMVVAGYPAVERKQAGKKLYAALLAVPTTIIGEGNAPPSALAAPPPGLQVQDLWIADYHEKRVDGKWTKVVVPQLGGASGGSCWRAYVRPVSEPWSSDRMRIVGAHIGSKPDFANHKGEKYRQMREVLIGHHLRMIADDYPSLREAMFKVWPSLQDPIWR
jgi:hypothetical protein